MAEVINTNVFDAEKEISEISPVLIISGTKQRSTLMALMLHCQVVLIRLLGIFQVLKQLLVMLILVSLRIYTLTDRVDALGGAEGGIDSMIDAKINALDSNDEAVAGEYVSSVAQADGKITVVRAALPDYSERTHDKGVLMIWSKTLKIMQMVWQR